MAKAHIQASLILIVESGLNVKTPKSAKTPNLLGQSAFEAEIGETYDVVVFAPHTWSFWMSMTQGGRLTKV